jgi:hypothetical protein
MLRAISVTSPPTFLRGVTSQSWTALAKPSPNVPEAFDPNNHATLPAPVLRWLRHTIAPGTPILAGAQISMHGDIRIGKWRAFTAQQIVDPSGYIWAAEAGRFPMKIQGFDRYSATTGEMSWRLFGRIPVVKSFGADIDRSAAGRLASEIIGLTPGGAIGPNVTWAAIDEHHAVASIIIDGRIHEVTIDVADSGALRTVSLPRWGSPDKTPFQLHTFGVFCDGEFTTEGYTLPRRVSAGWWPGTPKWEQGEFFRATIDQARFY